MSESTCAETLFSSKEDFLAGGLTQVSLEEPLDCPICREPLAFIPEADDAVPLRLPRIEITRLPRVTIPEDSNTRNTDATPQSDTDNPQLADQHPSEQAPSTSITTSPLTPEAPVRIHSCNHIFGTTCLTTYLSLSPSNRCPICAQPLFRAPKIHLGLREPTPAMRSAFAEFVEHVIGDADTAELIRERLMSGWTRALMRELAVEMVRDGVREVSWEYVGEEEEEGSEEEDGYDDGDLGEEDEGDEMEG